MVPCPIPRAQIPCPQPPPPQGCQPGRCPLGADNSLLCGAAVCTVRCAAAPLASAHQTPASGTRARHQAVTTKNVCCHCQVSRGHNRPHLSSTALPPLTGPGSAVPSAPAGPGAAPGRPAADTAPPASCTCCPGCQCQPCLSHWSPQRGQGNRPGHRKGGMKMLRGRAGERSAPLAGAPAPSDLDLEELPQLHQDLLGSGVLLLAVDARLQ